MVPPQPRLTSPPLGVVGGRGAPEALPSLLPPSSPHPGEGRYNLWLQLYTSEKKKKSLQNVPHRKKKKNPKPSEKNLRVGLADGIIKASPEPRLALPLRQPPGEQPRPAGPAPSPMDLRAGRSLASEALAPAPAREPRDPVPVPPPGAPSRGRAGEPGATPASRARAGGGTAGRPREGPGGNAAFLKSTPRGQEVAGSAAGSPGDPLTRRAGNLEPLRDGVPGSRRKEPRAKVGERESVAGSGAAGGKHGAQGEGGRGGGGEKGGEPEAGPAGG